MSVLRSESRVRKNNTAVPLQQKDEFKQKTRMLLDPMTSKCFYDLINDIRSRFPKCVKWLDWYLHKDRAKLIFPAVANADFVDARTRNTNAQESMGRTIQMTCEQANPSLVEL